MAGRVPTIERGPREWRLFRSTRTDEYFFDGSASAVGRCLPATRILSPVPEPVEPDLVEYFALPPAERLRLWRER